MIRLGRLPKDFKESGRISAVQLGNTGVFELSSLDKKSVPPHLSVWVDALTTSEQAYQFLQEGSPCRLVLRLKVQEIREIVGYSGDGIAHPKLLDVIWVHLSNNIEEEQVNLRRPGACGHSGITGLDEQSASSKVLRKDLRAKLAELASKDCHLLSQEF